MEKTTTETTLPDAQQHAAARSTLYRHLATWLAFPWPQFHEIAVAGGLAPAIRECLVALPYAMEGVADELACLAEVERDYDEFQSAYVRLFDVGAGGPPCPLSGGAWVGDRQKVMEEALRFYRYFGLTTSQDQQDLPDHLTTQLEFLHFLTFRELEAVGRGEDAGALRRAARDFLLRHPVRWLPLASAQLAKIDAPPFWRGLLGLAAAYCRADADHLSASEGPVHV